MDFSLKSTNIGKHFNFASFLKYLCPEFVKIVKTLSLLHNLAFVTILGFLNTLWVDKVSNKIQDFPIVLFHLLLCVSTKPTYPVQILLPLDTFPSSYPCCNMNNILCAIVWHCILLLRNEFVSFLLIETLNKRIVISTILEMCRLKRGPLLKKTDFSWGYH